MNKADNLHDVKIIGNGQSNSIFIDREDVSCGCLEANLNIKAGEFPRLVMKTDVKVSSIELKAEVKKIHSKSMNFGEALELLKQGKKVARSGWNGKGMYIFLQEGSYISSDDARNKHLAQLGSMDIEIKPHIDMKAADGTITIGWNPSQVDMLAEDWSLTE